MRRGDRLAQCRRGCIAVRRGPVEPVCVQERQRRPPQAVDGGAVGDEARVRVWGDVEWLVTSWNGGSVVPRGLKMSSRARSLSRPPPII